MKTLRTHLIALLVGIVTLVAGTSSATAQRDASDKAFEQMLRAIDTVPTRPAMEKRWPNIQERLLTAAHQETRDTYTRSRAVSLLSFFPDATSRSALKALSVHAQSRIRSISIYTLARTFGVPGDKELLATIEARLTDAVRDVQAQAIRGLRWVRHPRAATLLSEVSKNATDKMLKRLAEKTLQRRRF
jgi:HEAT repeat protein